MVKKILAMLILVSAISSVALADVPDSLKGTWVIDTKATEEYLKNSSPKLEPKEAEWFPLYLGYMLGTILTFDNRTLTTSTYLGGKAFTYQLISQQNETMKYVFKTDKDDQWTVSLINKGKNISIKAAKTPSFELCLWKRVKLDLNAKNDDVKRVLEDYKTMIENIKSVPIIAAGTESWDDEALLHDGRTVELHRHITLGGRNLLQGISTWPDTHSFEATNPDTGKTVKWSGERHVNPIMLDFVDGVPYLVVLSEKVFSNVKLYGCPEIPYAFLMYEQETSQWVPVPHHLAPRALRMANLSPNYDGGYMMNGKRQTKEFILGRYKVNKYTSGGFFNAEIPQNYDTWDCKDKLSYKNKRFKNDCRPPLPSEVEVSLPPPQEVALEILDANDYNPVRILAQDEWGRLTFDKDRSEYSVYGKSLFKQADPNEPWLGKRFTKDLTGQKIVPYNKSGFHTGVHRLCDKKYILYYAHLEIPGKMIMTKYTVTGDMLYRISFQKPEEVKGFTGYIHTPSIKSGNGYLTFEWWHFRNYNRKWEVKRTLKVRLREPTAANKK
jgi:hypothetical protein